MNREFQVKDNHLLQYFHKAFMLVKDLEDVKIIHIPCEENERADMSKLMTGKKRGILNMLIRHVLLKPLVECMEVSLLSRFNWREDIRRLMAQQ